MILIEWDSPARPKWNRNPGPFTWAKTAEEILQSLSPNGRCVATGNLTGPGVDGPPGNDHAEWHEGGSEASFSN